MNRKLAACVFGLLLIAVFGSLQAAMPSRHVEAKAPVEPVSITLPDRKCQGVQATGQTTSYDVGDDGAYQKGWTMPGTYPRFTDNSNGTVKDNLTGLIWLKKADCFEAQKWATALSSANTLASGGCGGALTDGSLAGDWRLRKRSASDVLDEAVDI